MAAEFRGKATDVTEFLRIEQWQTAPSAKQRHHHQGIRLTVISFINAEDDVATQKAKHNRAQSIRRQAAAVGAVLLPAHVVA